MLPEHLTNRLTRSLFEFIDWKTIITKEIKSYMHKTHKTKFFTPLRVFRPERARKP